MIHWLFKYFAKDDNTIVACKKANDDKVNATITINITSIVNVINSDNFDNRIIVTGIVNQIVKEDMRRTHLPEDYYFGSDDYMSILYLTNK